MTSFSPGRRGLFMATAGGALAAPFLMTGATQAQDQTPETAMTTVKTRGFTLGAFKVTVISDGTRIADNPHETYGTNQPKEAVEKLLHANFLPKGATPAPVAGAGDDAFAAHSAGSNK